MQPLFCKRVFNYICYETKHLTLKIIHILCTFFALLTFEKSNAQSDSSYTELPFKISQTGQIIIEVRINDKLPKALFYLETNGKNYIRSDQPENLELYGLNQDKQKTTIDSIQLGDFTYKKTNFHIHSSLEERGNIAFPSSIFGTINLSLFKKQVIQLNFSTKVLKITNHIEDVNISNNAKQLPFKCSLTNSAVSFGIDSKELGKRDIAIDTRSPLGIHFFYSDLTLLQRKKHKNSFKKRSYKLDGETPLNFAYTESYDLLSDNNLAINKQEILFSNYIPNSIGNGFLKHFIVTINFINNTLFFDPISSEGKTFFKTL